MKNCPIVFCCDGRARAAITASWYRQMGHRAGVCGAWWDGGEWQSAGEALEQGHSLTQPLGLEEARSKVRMLAPSDVPVASDASITLVGTSGGPAAYVRGADESPAADASIIFVGTSQQFAEAHVPGSRWVPRGWLEAQIGDVAPDKAAPVVVTCVDGVASTFAGAALADEGYADVSVLEGGMRAWHDGWPIRNRERAYGRDVNARRCGACRHRPRLRGHDELPALGGGTREEVRILSLRGLAIRKGYKQA